MNSGKIVQVIGPVVDVQFAENAIPPILQALTVDFSAAGKEQSLTLEVQQATAWRARSRCRRRKD
jgi:F-type H+-transporting ATPase subunit beta